MKTMRVLQPILFVALCLMMQVDTYGSTGDNFSGNNITEYHINTAEELAAICTNSHDRLYVLGSDITIPPGWVPIGHGAPGNDAAFKGELDGRGYSIIGLDIDVTCSGAFGLFGKLEGANISNLVLVDARMQVAGDVSGHKLTAGLLAGEAVGSTISNVIVENGYISATTSGLENAIIGGVVGIATDTSFRNTGIISGVINGGDITGGFAGRIAGTGAILECYSHADVVGSIAGGFAGQVLGSTLPGNANHAITIAECSATGTVSSAGNTGALAYGIAGGFIGEGEYVFIRDSSAYGKVIGCKRAGGFVGRLSNLSRVIYAYAKGDVTVDSGFAGGFVGELINSACVEFSFSVGSVIAVGGHESNGGEYEHTKVAVGGFVGAISGHGAPNTITHCLSFAPWVVGDGYVNRFVGLLDHDGVNGCYAHLGSMVVREGYIIHVLPSAFGPDGADMSSAQVEDVTKRLGWKRMHFNSNPENAK
ncbi:MAG: hypothetical protein FWC92_07635 [Defluviitaleaceae bacterium]|nr:hypothetical protein [Defluviitaleaceae bacterium]